MSQNLYEDHPRYGGPFDGNDRIKLIRSILEADAGNGVNGAGLNLKDLKAKKVRCVRGHTAGQRCPQEAAPRWLTFECDTRARIAGHP